MGHYKVHLLSSKLGETFNEIELNGRVKPVISEGKIRKERPQYSTEALRYLSVQIHFTSNRLNLNPPGLLAKLQSTAIKALLKSSKKATYNY